MRGHFTQMSIQSMSKKFQSILTKSSLMADEWCYFIIYILVLCAVSLNTSLSKNDKSVFTTSLCSKILKNAKYRGVTKTSKSPFVYKLKIIWWIWSLKLPQNFKKNPLKFPSRGSLSSFVLGFLLQNLHMFLISYMCILFLVK